MKRGKFDEKTVSHFIADPILSKLMQRNYEYTEKGDPCKHVRYHKYNDR